MNDVMLDLETMGLRPDAAIVAIGAVEFDIEKGALGRSFYTPVDLTSSIQHGGIVDGSTVMWWLRQSDEARKALVAAPVGIGTALAEFSAFIGGRQVRVWGNGAAFDNVVLRRAYERHGMTVPWAHRNDRCYRTIKAQHPAVACVRIGVHHQALDDARSQAIHLIKMLVVQHA